MEPKRVLPGTKRVLPAINKGNSKGSPMGTAEEPFKVLDHTFLKKKFTPLVFPSPGGPLGNISNSPGSTTPLCPFALTLPLGGLHLSDLSPDLDQ